MLFRSLCQAPVCRAGGSVGLSVPLYAPGGDLEPAADRVGRTGRHLPLEGLPGYGTDPSQDNDTGGRRVHAPLSAACAARRISPYPPLRAARQRGAAGESGQGAGTTAGCAELGDACEARGAASPGSAHLCVPVLRSGDGRRRDPRTQPVDPRSPATIGLPMNTHVPRCANRLSAPGLPTPQGDACAEHGELAVSYVRRRHRSGISAVTVGVRTALPVMTARSAPHRATVRNFNSP